VFIMVDANFITDALSDGKLSTKEITDLVAQKSPLPVPTAIIQGLLDQLVAKGTIKKTEENGETYYHL